MSGQHNLEKNISKKFFELLPRDKRFSPYKITSKRIIIGSSETCDMVIASFDVSPIHAVVELTKNGGKVYDMNSPTGTFVNGKKVIVSDLHVGSQIRFGKVEVDFKYFEEKDLPPPVLNVLSEQLPGVIEERMTLKNDLAKEKQDTLQNKSQNKLQNKLPSKLHKEKLPSMPQKMKEEKIANDEEIPYVSYPLAKDPKAEFSEYIFEDVDELQPIFKYEISKRSIEVIILFNQRIYSVDYIPVEDGEYSLVGYGAKKPDIEYAYLGKKDKFKFLEVKNGEVILNGPDGYDCQSISSIGNDSRKNQIYNVVIAEDDIYRFRKSNLEIFVRVTNRPPKVRPAPIVAKDPELKKYLLIMFLLAFLASSALVFVKFEKVDEEEKAPERIATILYKTKKLVVKKEMETVTTEQKQKEKKVVKLKVEKPQEVKKEERVAEPNAGNPNVEKVGEVKKGTPPQKQSDVDKTAAQKAASKSSTLDSSNSPKKSATNEASVGTVDTYKSVDFSSTVSSLLRKGGSAKNVQQAGSSESAIGSEGSSLDSSSSSITKAQVSQNIGSLSGSVDGKLDSSKGVEGLVNKKNIYSIGVPSSTIILGSMDPDLIRAKLMENAHLFRSCYERVLKRSAEEFKGVLPLNFVIGASGNVVKAGVNDNSGDIPPSVQVCVINYLKMIQFPEPLGGGVVEVNQPMYFYHNQ